MSDYNYTPVYSLVFVSRANSASDSFPYSNGVASTKGENEIRKEVTLLSSSEAILHFSTSTPLFSIRKGWTLNIPRSAWKNVFSFFFFRYSSCFMSQRQTFSFTSFPFCLTTVMSLFHGSGHPSSISTCFPMILYHLSDLSYICTT